MINIAELLKDAPRDLKLYSPICGHCKLSCILYDDGIRVIAHDVPFRFDKYGRFCSADDAECLLFPSKGRTWEGWKLHVEPKFKDGDVLCTYECGNPKIVFILRGKSEGNYSVLSYYCYYNIMYPHFESNAERGCLAPKRENVKPATKEQRDLLFAKMKEAGYEWDEKKKELKNIPKHYDISNFHAGMPVLVRDYDNSRWSYVQFSHYVGEECGFKFNACGIPYIQCIPFEGNEALLGTTDMCDEMYINW